MTLANDERNPKFSSFPLNYESPRYEKFCLPDGLAMCRFYLPLLARASGILPAFPGTIIAIPEWGHRRGSGLHGPVCHRIESSRDPGHSHPDDHFEQ